MSIQIDTLNIIPVSLNNSTMSSLEIAELTGKEHRNVLSDIRKMIVDLELNATDFSAPQSYGNNNTREVFNLNEELTITLVSGYNIRMRNAIIKRWQTLEGRSAPLSRLDAAKLQVRLIEELEAAEAKVEDLKIELDESSLWSSIKRVHIIYNLNADWRLLKKSWIKLDIPPHSVFDANYGTVQSYHAEVWLDAYDLDITQ